MPGELFQLSETSGESSGRGRWYTVPVSILVHATALMVAIGVPLLATDALPTPEAVLAFVAPPPAPTAPSPPALTAAAPRVTAPPDLNPGAAPLEAPAVIAPEPPPTLAPLVGMTPPATPAGASVPNTLPGPPPLPPPTVPLRVGGDIREPRKTHDVTPAYPAVAQAARVEGTVILEATISKDGTVRDVRVLRSIPLLDQAAVDAVRQWRYTTPTLNGEPVDVLMTVMVKFGLAR
jgi:periplasmic protein TonB